MGYLSQDPQRGLAALSLTPPIWGGLNLVLGEGGGRKLCSSYVSAPCICTGTDGALRVRGGGLCLSQACIFSPGASLPRCDGYFVTQLPRGRKGTTSLGFCYKTTARWTATIPGTWRSAVGADCVVCGRLAALTPLCPTRPSPSSRLTQARFHGSGMWRHTRATWRHTRVGTSTAMPSTFCLSKPVLGRRNTVCIRGRTPKSCDKGHKQRAGEALWPLYN